MHSTSLKWLEMQRVAAAQAGHRDRGRDVHLVRENLRLIEENESLRRRCADLAASAELWIRLYEAALIRANGSAAAPAGAANVCEAPRTQDGTHEQFQ